MISLEDREQYHSNAQTHAAVHAVMDIAQRFHKNAGSNLLHGVCVQNRVDAEFALRDELIKFFCQYDRARTECLEQLEKRVCMLLQSQSFVDSQR